MAKAKKKSAKQKACSKNNKKTSIATSLPVWNGTWTAAELEVLEPQRQEESEEMTTMEALLAENRRLRSKHEHLTKTLAEGKKESSETHGSMITYAKFLNDFSLWEQTMENNDEGDLRVIENLVNIIHGCCLMIQLATGGAFNYRKGLEVNLFRLKDVLTDAFKAEDGGESRGAATDGSLHLE